MRALDFMKAPELAEASASAGSDSAS